MISEELQIKLQAWLDGELSPTDAAEMQALAARDPDARALVEELRHTVAALSTHEAVLKVPETREFYWSKIQREINRQQAAAESAPQKSLTWFAWLQRHFLPVSAVALVACLLGIYEIPGRQMAGQDGEIELASADVGSYTYRDQSEQMTMVWLYDKNADETQIADSPVPDDMDPQ